MQQDTGVLYRYENGGLRPYGSHEVYKSWGTPPYSVVSAEAIDRCFSKGPPMDMRVTTTPPPVPTEAPTHPPFTDTSLYVLVHAGLYLKTGRLPVLSLNFGQLGTEEFMYKDLSQVWSIHANGYIRNVAGSGKYLAGTGDCLAPTTETLAVSAAKWTIRPTGSHQYAYSLRSSCGRGLAVSNGTSIRTAATLADGGDEWYLVPVGTTL